MTEQRTQMIPPEDDRQDIGITIKCEDCRAWLTFKVSTQLVGLERRVIRSFGISSSCEHCGRSIDVAIGWLKFEKGYSGIELGTGPNFQTVVDNTELVRRK